MPKQLGLIPDPPRVNELARYYGIMGNKILSELIRIDAESFTKVKAMSVQKNAQELVNEMNRRAIQWTNKSIPEAYGDAVEISRITLGRIGAVRNKDYDTKAHKRSIDNEEELTEKDLIKANLSINQNVATYIYLMRRAHEEIIQIQAFDLRDEETISNLLDDAIKEGASRGKLERLIRIHFKRDLFEKKFILINGKNFDMIKYAKMVARTRLRTVQSDAIRNMAKQFDNDLIEISSHGTDDDICREFEGNTYSLSGKTPGYEKMPSDGWPPYHPNCEHFASPTSVGAIETRGRA